MTDEQARTLGRKARWAQAEASRKPRLAAGFRWDAVRNPTTGNWVASCDALGLDVQADGLDALLDLAGEVTLQLLVELRDEGVIDEFCAACGLAPIDVPPALTADGIPLELVVRT